MRILSSLVLIVGLLLMTASFFSEHLPVEPDVTEEDLARYNEAINLAHERAAVMPIPQAELDKAHAVKEATKAKLQATLDRRNRLESRLRWSGIATALLGVVGYLWSKRVRYGREDAPDRFGDSGSVIP